MTTYLSPQWFSEASARVTSTNVTRSDQPPVTFSYAVSGFPDDHPRAAETVSYRIALDPSTGGATLSESEVHGDIHFSMQYSTAVAVASGERGGSRAFLDGDIRVGGDIAMLIARSADLEALNRLLPKPGSSDA